MTRGGPTRSFGQRAVLSVNVIAILASLVLATGLYFGKTRAERLERVQLDGSLAEVERNEEGDRVLNILLVGSDSSAGLDPDDPISVGRAGEHFSDVMIIAHLDERDGTAALLSLPRDLWVEIAETERDAKLNSAFYLGGPAGLIDTIETNFGIPINYYVNVDFAGFRGLVEAVGSVEVAFDQPARDWNTQYDRSQTGFLQETAGCIPLGPDDALAYVRSRHYQTMDADGNWISDPNGDLGRIERQQGFLKRLLSTAIDQGARNPFVLRDLIDSTLDSVTVDQQLTPQLLVDLGRRYSAFEPEDLKTYSYPGFISSEGTISIVRGMDTEAEPILALFAGAASDDPATVLVRIKADEERRDLALDVADHLAAEGFEPDQVQTIDAPSGIELRHGPDGVEAANIVLNALQPDASLSRLGLDLDQVTLVPTDGLTGREVIVSIGPETQVSQELDAQTASTNEDGATVPPSTSQGSSDATTTSSTMTTVDVDEEDEQVVSEDACR